MIPCYSLFPRIIVLSTDYQQQYSFLAQYILCSPRFNSGIFCLTTYYSIKYHSLAQIIDENIPTQLSVFYIHPNYTREYSVLPHILPANIIPWPGLFPQIFTLSPDYQRYILS